MSYTFGKTPDNSIFSNNICTVHPLCVRWTLGLIHKNQTIRTLRFHWAEPHPLCAVQQPWQLRENYLRVKRPVMRTAVQSVHCKSSVCHHQRQYCVLDTHLQYLMNFLLPSALTNFSVWTCNLRHLCLFHVYTLGKYKSLDKCLWHQSLTDTNEQ